MDKSTNGSEFEPVLDQKNPLPLRRQEFYLPKSEFSRIADHLLRPQRIRDNLQKEIDKSNKKRELSKDMVKNWSQTIDRMLSEKHETFLKQRQLIEEERNRLFNESQEKFAEEKRLFVEKARKSLFLKESCPLELTNAMKCGQIDEERKKQIELKKMFKQHEDDLEEVYARKVKQAAQEEVAEKREAARIRRETAVEFKKLCYQQYLDQKAYEQSEKEARIKSEAEDNVKNREEMETLERQQRKIADKYKRNLKKTNDQFFKLQKTVKDKFVIEDEEQEEAMKVYNDAKHKMECKKKEKEREKIAERFKKSEKFGRANEEQRLTLEAKENANIAKANKELDELEEQKASADLEKKRAFKEELQNFREQQLIDEDIKRRNNETILKWNMLNVSKKNEVIKETIQKEEAKRLKQVSDYRDELLKQMDKSNVKAKEKELDVMLAKNAFAKFKEMDDKFLNYAEEVKEMCDANGWNKFGVDRVIEQYKKNNNLWTKKSRCGDK